MNAELEEKFAAIEQSSIRQLLFLDQLSANRGGPDDISLAVRQAQYEQWRRVRSVSRSIN